MMKYSPQLLEYFHNRTHAGRLDRNATDVYFAQSGHPENQEIFALYIQYNQQIEAVKFQAAGSVMIIAAGEFICRWLQGKTWVNLKELSCEFILNSLNLSTLNTPTAQLVLLTIQKIINCNNVPI